MIFIKTLHQWWSQKKKFLKQYQKVSEDIFHLACSCWSWQILFNEGFIFFVPKLVKCSMVLINFTRFISKLPHLITKCFGYETSGNRSARSLKRSTHTISEHRLHVSANGVFVSLLSHQQSFPSSIEHTNRHKRALFFFSFNTPCPHHTCLGSLRVIQNCWSFWFVVHPKLAVQQMDAGTNGPGGVEEQARVSML